MSNTFHELEQSVKGCARIIDDLKMISNRLQNEDRKLNERDMGDLIQGLAVLYQMKFDKMWVELIALEDFKDK